MIYPNCYIKDRLITGHEVIKAVNRAEITDLCRATGRQRHLVRRHVAYFYKHGGLSPAQLSSLKKLTSEIRRNKRR